jgi:fatty acid desaturase
VIDAVARCTLFLALLTALLHAKSDLLAAACVAALAVVQVGLVGSLFHECVHRNLSISDGAQDWVARVVGAPLALSLSWWRVKHVRLHHPHVGDVDRDPDIQFASVARVKAYQDWRSQYRFQVLYGPVAFVLVGFNMLSPLELRRVDPDRRRITLRLVAEKYVLFSAFWGVVALARGVFDAFTLFLVFEGVAGALGSVIVQLQHNTTLANRRADARTLNRWSRQYYSTADTRSRMGVWWWVSGGTSRHIAHHLHPRLTYIQLPRATTVLRSTVPDWPEHRNVWDAIASHVRHIRLLGHSRRI